MVVGMGIVTAMDWFRPMAFIHGGTTRSSCGGE